MKIIKVKNCFECIYSKKDYYYYYCYKDGQRKKIDDKDIIPSWCPLEDYKGEKYRKMWEKFKKKYGEEYIVYEGGDSVGDVMNEFEKIFKSGGRDGSNKHSNR